MDFTGLKNTDVEDIDTVYKRLNFAEVPTIFLDLPYEKAVAYVLADNNLARLAEEDRELLAEVLRDVAELENFDFEATGFDYDELDKLLEKAGADPGGEGVDQVDDESPERSQRGDLWSLGPHRLLCGDATSLEDLKKLLGGAEIDLCLTDPPYGVSIVNKGGMVGNKNVLNFDKATGTRNRKKEVSARTYKTIKGDDTIETAYKAYRVLEGMHIKNFIIWGGNYFTDFLSPSRCWIVWDKENSGNFADCELAWSDFDKPAKLFKWMWNGLTRKGKRDIEGVSRVHPTQKPVGLHVEILEEFTTEGALVLDPFLGSGTTLIACEQARRSCYGVEFEPGYCDIIIERWERLTGQEAVKIEN
jgi:DNA modification methylase